MKILHKRATIDILTIAGLATFAILAGDAVAQQSTPAEPPKQTASDTVPDRKSASGDAWITAKVKAALLADPDVRGLALEVETKNGVVTLRGAAVTQAEVEAAKKIALGIEGVRDVEVRSVGIGAQR